MKKRIGIIGIMIAFVMVLTMFTGCTNPIKKLADDVKKTQDEKAKNDPGKVLKSADGKTQITVPSDWTTETNLNSNASLQASNKLKEEYIITISEAKTSFADSMTMQDYYDIISKNMTSAAQNASISEVTDTTINGYKAKQFRLNGEVSKIKIAYLIAVIETKGSFHQILTWTLQNKYDERKAELLKVLSSFKENE